MRTLIVIAHADPDSLTQAVARAIGDRLRGEGQDIEFADLSAEGFDPRFGPADLAVHRRQVAPPPEVLAEQARVDRADQLVLVFPLYWWSMPALMKGWIDRVFSQGWAFEDKDGKLIKKLGRLRVQLVALGGADTGLLERHGYDTAIQTQLAHGIFDYCGVKDARTALLMESDTGRAQEALARADALGRELAAQSQAA
ncbi:NAD(P)H-dependent oxidoreductase [Pseudomonadota bacterium AL_CKDN230030165-1A_HGKHYDSX7]